MSSIMLSGVSKGTRKGYQASSKILHLFLIIYIIFFSDIFIAISLIRSLFFNKGAIIQMGLQVSLLFFSLPGSWDWSRGQKGAINRYSFRCARGYTCALCHLQGTCVSMVHFLYFITSLLSVVNNGLIYRLKTFPLFSLHLQLKMFLHTM